MEAEILVPGAECKYGRDHVMGDVTHGGAVTRCPTCGSSDPAVRHGSCLCTVNPSGTHRNTDPFHTPSPREGEE